MTLKQSSFSVEITLSRGHLRMTQAEAGFVGRRGVGVTQRTGDPFLELGM